MKEVYIKKYSFIVKLINGKVLEYSSDESYGRYLYQYGIKPQEHIEVFDNRDTVFKDLLNRLGFLKEYNGSQTKFSKRVYVDDYEYFKRRFYKDEIMSFEIKYSYETVENPVIKYLEEDLGFNGYSELIFNREQELKNMLLKGE